jgi:hypothetical protein
MPLVCFKLLTLSCILGAGQTEQRASTITASALEVQAVVISLRMKDALGYLIPSAL